MAVRINANELEKLLAATPASQNIMLTGKHGIGKSQILERFFTSRGERVVILFLGQMSDPGDLIGLPRLDEVAGKTIFIPPFPTPDGPAIAVVLPRSKLLSSSVFSSSNALVNII